MFSCRLLDDVRKEITALRGTNAELWAQIEELNAEKRKLEENGSSFSSTKKIELLTEVSFQLEHEVYVLCEQLTTFEITREQELADIQDEHERVIKEHGMLVAKMKAALKEKDKCCEEERKDFEEKIAQQEKLHRAEMLRSMDELKRTKESHRAELSELTESLNAAQSASKEQTARLNEELDVVKKERDALVRKLRRLARQGDVPRSDARKEELRLDKDEMTATTHNVVPAKPRHRGREDETAKPWATKPVWVKHGSFWVKNE